MLLRALVITSLALAGSAAWGQQTKIVGIGAVPCARFLTDIGAKPAIERDYLAWAQEFMSRALVRAPDDVDVGLDLNPPTFPLTKQAEFIRTFCAVQGDRDYMDAVHALYRHLRGPGT